MEIVRIGTADFTRLWQQVFVVSEFQHPLYQPWNIQFYEALAPKSQFEDCSFVVEEQGVPLAGVRMAFRASGDASRELSGFGLPLLYLENQDINSTQLQGAHKLLKGELERIMQAHSVTSLIYQDFLYEGRLSYLGRYLLEIGARGVPYFTQIIDLTVSETDLYRQIRKSYKSLINWGKKNLVLQVKDETVIAPEDIEAFRELHLKAAGRETRSQRTWDLQYEMVSHNEAFVIAGKLEGELVTAALFPYSARYCFYGVSASKRELFSKPLSHAIIWRAMLYAKEQGCNFFELPEQRYPKQGTPLPTNKELSISTFKHGFGGKTYVRLNMAWKRRDSSFKKGKPDRQ